MPRANPARLLAALLACACTAFAQTPINVGQTVNGNLTAASGRSQECPGCYADLYQFSITSPQALLIRMNSTAFDTYLRVYDSSGRLVAENDDESATSTNSLVNFSFPAGTYRIEASTYNDETSGPYTLSVQAITITVIPISVGQTLNRTLSNTSGRSLVNTSHFADHFQLTLSASQAISIAMSSTAFDTYLRVFNAAGAELANDDDSGGGTNSLISRIFPAGTYRIEASTYSAGDAGVYTISVQAITARTIAVGQSATGTLSAASGRSAYCTGCYTDLYQFTLSQAQTVVIAMTSTAFDTVLIVLDANGLPVAADDDGGGGTNSQIVRLFSAGTYRIEARAYSENQGGAYNLSLQALNTTPQVRPIAVGQTQTGTLSRLSGRSARCSECAADHYSLTLAASQTLVINLTSSQFDAFLQVLDASGNAVATDDDSGGGTNSLLNRTLPAGAYRIEVTTYSGGETGTYSLSVRAATPPVITPINVGQTVSGTLTASDGRSLVCADCFADTYQFNLGAAQGLIISMGSNEFDVLLRVFDANGVLVAADDDSGAGPRGTDALIRRDFAAGTYRIEATSFSAGSGGAYSLSVQTAPPVVVRPIAVGATLNGTLTPQSGRSAGCSSCFADIYQFSVASQQTLFITMASGEFDTFLRVLDANGVWIAVDDDSGGGTNSRISHAFTPGTYRIEATTYSGGERGSYTLALLTGLFVPAPSIRSLTPSSTSPGGAGFTLVVLGNSFVSGAEVRWNGQARSTTFVSSTELRANITVADVASPGTAQVTVFNPPPGGGSSRALAFTIIPAQAQVAVTPEVLTFEAPQGGVNPPAKTISVTNLGRGSLRFTVERRASGGAWLNADATSALAPATLAISVNVAGLAPGAYTGSVVLRGDFGDPRTVAVTLVVTRAAPVLRLSQTGFVFQGAEGALNVAAQTFQVLNAGTGGMSWTARASSEGNWLSVSPASGTSQGGVTTGAPVVNVRVDGTNLKAGAHVGLITIEAPDAANSPTSAMVMVNMRPPGSDAEAGVQPAGLSFIAVARGSAVPAQRLSLSSTGGKQLQYDITTRTADGTNWLSVSPTSGSLARASDVASINVNANHSSLQPGFYTGTIVIGLSAGRPLEIAVALSVAPPGTVLEASSDSDGGEVGRSASQCNRTRLVMVETVLAGNFAVAMGWPQAVRARVQDDCGRAVTDASVSATFNTGEGTLVFDNLRNGFYSKTWVPARESNSVIITMRAGAPGVSEARLTVEGKVQAAGGPLLFTQSAVNGASFERFAPLAPGSIFSVFGRNLPRSPAVATQLPLPLNISEVQVTLGGRPVPLFYVGQGSPDYEQINGQVPFDLTPGTTTSLVVTVRGRAASPEQVTLTAVQPGIFLAGGSQGAVLNVSNQLVNAAAPAAVNDILQVYCTGLGATNPPVTAGTASPSNPPAVATAQVTATIGGINAPVHFAGLAPGFVGLYQVNVQVPEGVTPGSAVPLVITQNGVNSNTATIAVQ